MRNFTFFSEKVMVLVFRCESKGQDFSGSPRARFIGNGLQLFGVFNLWGRNLDWCVHLFVNNKLINVVYYAVRTYFQSCNL